MNHIEKAIWTGGPHLNRFSEASHGDAIPSSRGFTKERAPIVGYMSVSINGVYKNYDHMHVAFPRIIPANHTTNHTHESYYESYP